MNPFSVHHILAPTDLSASSIPALECARLFAERFSAKLTVMYSDPVIYPNDFAGPAGAVYINVGPDHFDQLEKEVRQHAGEALAGVPFDVEVTVGSPIPTILGAVKEKSADLVIVGTHLRHGWQRALLGSVSDGVLHRSSCPVLTVAGRDGGAQRRGIAHVLCPVNFTEVAAESLRVACGVAAAFGARLTVVHVVESEDAVAFARDEERVRRWIEPELRDRCCFRELVVRGGAAERVLDCADDASADLLVVGAQHKLFRDDTVIGATTERLIRFASCPVLVVPRQPARQTALAFEEATQEGRDVAISFLK